uniref:Uncharacterized protein n=1 Tax=Timema cristinae TaxID=61476 RepID=A0A7R9CI48_TIMCR|nr:unnamed protein product [Timema cristinae]
MLPLVPMGDFHGMNYLGHFKQLLSNMDSYNWEGITQQPDKMVSLRSNFDQNNSGHKQIVHVYRSRKGGSYNTNKRSEATHRKRGRSVAVSTPRKGPQQSDVEAPSNILLHSIINKDINNKSSEQLLEKVEISPNRRLLGKTEIYPEDSTTQHKSNLELYLQQIDMMDDKDKTMDSTTLKDEETNMNLTMISHHVQSNSSQASSKKHKSSFDFTQTNSTTQNSALDIAKLNVHNVYKPSFFSQIQTRNNKQKELHTQHSGSLQTLEESLEDPEVQIYNSQVYVNQYIYPFPESSQSNTSFYEPPIRFRTKTHISLALALLLTRPVLPRLASKEGPGAGSDSGREWVRWCEHPGTLAPVVVMVVVLTHIAGNTHTAPPTPHTVSENYFTHHSTSYIMFCKNDGDGEIDKRVNASQRAAQCMYAIVKNEVLKDEEMAVYKCVLTLTLLYEYEVWVCKEKHKNKLHVSRAWSEFRTSKMHEIFNYHAIGPCLSCELVADWPHLNHDFLFRQMTPLTLSLALWIQLTSSTREVARVCGGGVVTRMRQENPACQHSRTLGWILCNREFHTLQGLMWCHTKEKMYYFLFDLENVTGRPPIIPAVVCRRWVTLIGLLPSVADEDERVRVLGVISSLELLLLIALWTAREKGVGETEKRTTVNGGTDDRRRAMNKKDKPRGSLLHKPASKKFLPQLVFSPSPQKAYEPPNRRSLCSSTVHTPQRVVLHFMRK